MNELHKILLKLLKEFDEICKKYELRYYLSAGSNLGALRHSGIIPWDDDIDIEMPRNDYEKFCSIIDFELKEDRAFVTKERYVHYESPICRYIDTTTTVLIQSRMGDETPHGVFLDIIILDPIPDRNNELEKWKKFHYVYCEILDSSTISAARPANWDSIDICLYKKYYYLSKIFGKKRILKKLEKKLFCFNENMCKNYCLRFGNIWDAIVPIEWYKYHRVASFSGIRVSIPFMAERCAFLFYGPSWKTIPKNTYNAHVLFSMYDLDSGNCEREYFKLKTPEYIRRILETYTHNRVVAFKDKKEKYIIKHIAKQKYIMETINRKLKALDPDRNLMYPKVIMDLFKPYLDLQMKRLIRLNDIYIPIEDKALDIFIDTLFYFQSPWYISEILRIRDKAGVLLTKEQIKKKEIADDCLEAEIAIDAKDYGSLSKLVRKYKGSGDEYMYIVKAKIIFYYQMHKSAIDNIYLSRYILKAIKKFPNVLEFKKYLADVYMRLKKEYEARLLYKEVFNKTKNGVLLLELSKMEFLNKK